MVLRLAVLKAKTQISYILLNDLVRSIVDIFTSLAVIWLSVGRVKIQEKRFVFELGRKIAET